MPKKKKNVDSALQIVHDSRRVRRSCSSAGESKGSRLTKPGRKKVPEQSETLLPARLRQDNTTIASKPRGISDNHDNYLLTAGYESLKDMLSVEVTVEQTNTGSLLLTHLVPLRTR